MKRMITNTYRNKNNGYQNVHRILILLIIAGLCCFIIIGRLFQLQVLKYNDYRETAKGQHFGAIELMAQRGEILVRDTHSGELSKLATNTTLDLLYVDPMVAEDKEGIAQKIAPLLFNQEDYDACLEDPENCQYDVIRDDPLHRFETTQPAWDLGLNKEGLTEEEEPEYKDYLQLVQEVSKTILTKISRLEVDFVILRRDAEIDLMAEVINARLPGIFVDEKHFMIHGDPTIIPENRLEDVTKEIATLLGEPISSIKRKLSRRKVRYVFLKNRLIPEISRKIKAMKLKGVVLIPEHWRFYPEGELGSHLIGFLNREGVGQYGVEGYFNNELEGKKGTIFAESDPFGRQITVGDSKIEAAVNGDTIILTIDRIVQKNVEKILAESVKSFRADSGQVIVMNPFTGAIVAMANYPLFNPNDYSESFSLRELEEEELVFKTTPLFIQDEKGRFLPATDEQVENKEMKKYMYNNTFGPGAFKNKTVSEYYEPGSVFKPIVMAVALDAKEVEPQMTFLDDGPLKIDEFEIKNSDNEYHGKTTMTEVLELSLNTGMSWVAKKLGKQLLFNYLADFGFGEYTNVRLEGEQKGRLDYHKRWSKAQLLTTSFGQGIVVTPLQMVMAWAALANGGKLIQPYIVESIIKNKEVIKTEPEVIRRVLSEETSSIITSMLISTVRRGHGRPADIPGHLIAGKTGTSQVAGPSGKYETGEGATITSFAGYLPALEPQFVILVKFDRPRIGENTWGSTTGAPTFRKIAEFLIDYYNLPGNG